MDTTAPSEASSELNNLTTKSQTFELILMSGRAVKCHKSVLIQKSEFFKTMMNHEWLESTNNQMKVDQFADETVISFLQYLDARRNISVAGEESFFIRDFSKDKLTLELLSLAHFYQIQDLQIDCAEHLKSIISDENVIELWMAAERYDIKSLSKEAVKHLAERPEGKDIQEVPGFAEALESHPHSFWRDVMAVMSEKKKEFRDKISDFKEMKKEMLGDVIKVTVEKLDHDWTENAKIEELVNKKVEWRETVFVKPNNKVTTLVTKLARRRQPNGNDYRWNSIEKFMLFEKRRISEGSYYLIPWNESYNKQVGDFTESSRWWEPRRDIEKVHLYARERPCHPRDQ